MALDVEGSEMESPNVSQVLLLANYSNQESHGQVCYCRDGRYDVL